MLEQLLLLTAVIYQYTHKSSFHEQFEEGAALLEKVGRSCETSNKIEEILAKHRFYVTISKYSLVQSRKEVKDSLTSLAFLKDSTLKRGNCGTQLEWLVKASKCLLTVMPHIFGKNRGWILFLLLSIQWIICYFHIMSIELPLRSLYPSYIIVNYWLIY